MKKLLLSLGLLSTLVLVQAQTLLSENFEGSVFPPTGWTRTNTNASRAWDFTTVNFNAAGQAEYTISGLKSASINWIASPNTANLVTPSFSLVGTTSPVLSFKVVLGYSYMIVNDAGDLFAEISTNGGTTWTTLWNDDAETGFIDDGDGDPDTDLYNDNIVTVQRGLSAYAGQANVQIRFRYVGNDADVAIIDDVLVSASTLGTNDVGTKAKSINIYPNPTKGEINIKTDKKIKSSSITDLTGKSISRSSGSKINISSLPKGTYLMQVEFTDGTSSSEKVIKE
ncbi:Por secretion system C-terminal sorting domain-containing protein [Chryseobacterium sp. RU37D]|uniref:T9SS-dependent choice-of-anchor J family protein n=1 Tax=Chryseobacterium sp. RU37D TaxID=1907397 RepID=UPI000953F622|nr:T9SS type A sorting domain-containing protein [Chryseobacterium sp. RU37D]SIQ14253.1 Por secretion system C-terminal sorting domain-containing protein [Chryseobacterium sp. RU37D]